MQESGQSEAGPPARIRRDREDGNRLFQRAMPIYVALLLAILTIFGVLLLVRLQHVLLIIFIATILASAIARPSAYLERLHIPRAVAALAVYLVSLAIVVLIGLFVIPPLLGQVTNFAEKTPEYADRYQDLRSRYDELRQNYPELESFDDQVAGIRSRIVGGVGDRLINLPTTLFGLFLDVLAVFVISMLLLSAREKILALILSLTHPDYRAQTEDVLTKMWERIGFYVRAKIVVMVIIGALTYGALLLIGVPFALLLAIVVAFGEVIPRVGPWLARIPLLAIAALQGWETLGLTFIASVIIENAKGYAISPFVEGDQLDIHPLLVFIAVFVGGSLLGAAGAFVAVPAAAMVQVVVEEVIIPWRRGQLAEFESSGSDGKEANTTFAPNTPDR